MTDEERLEHSILHWKENLEKAKIGERYSISSASCAQCWKYCDARKCVGCPVSEKTGQSGCEGSPWQTVKNARNRFGPYARTTIMAIEEEIAFLESLRSNHGTE